MLLIERGLASHLERNMLVVCALIFVLILAYNVGRDNHPEPTITISARSTR